MAKIIFEDVTKIYPNGNIGVEGISLEVIKGEFVFIVGKSGSGKSTLLKLLTTQEITTTGDIFLDDDSIISVKSKDIPYIRRKFGVMDPSVGLLSDRTIYENIELVMVATEHPRKMIAPQVDEALEIVGLRKKKLRYPNELSGGEIARALLARAIVTKPTILVADEPTANLDPDTSWDLMCLLEDIRHQGITIIVASHAKELVSLMKKRVVTLAAGRIVRDERYGQYDSVMMERYERLYRRK
ncbi:cell division ATP-binding protein FtsE [Lachnospiraceae bacterium LCP25S3_G4]